MKKVMIGIQARSGSTRLPRKSFAMIAGKTMLDHVIDACKHGAGLIERKLGVGVDVVVLTPTNDIIAKEFSNRVAIVEGEPYDVLARYKTAVDKYNPDYVIRVTGDCPLLPPFIIRNLMEMTLRKNYDYVSNCDPRCRTSIDGFDCEVITRKLFDYVEATATRQYDREHVTPLIRSSPPPWARIGVALNNIDLSHIKLSVDTNEDLAAVTEAFDSAYRKYEDGKAIYKGGVHKI